MQRVQFSVPGESLEYFVIHGETPVAILERYTALTGRPADGPAWSCGPWLSTSYDEVTVTSFPDGMRDRDLPLSVFQFDCFWMREFQWCDFAWDPRVFGDPEAMLARLHDRGLRVNPYIGAGVPAVRRGGRGRLPAARPDATVWQRDLWQAGMGLVDFTSPDAVRWFQELLRRVLRQGVDSLQTDFGERVPRDVVHADGSDPERVHNLYTQRYNAAVHEVLARERPAEAVSFARSATADGARTSRRPDVRLPGPAVPARSGLAGHLRRGRRPPGARR